MKTIQQIVVALIVLVSTVVNAQTDTENYVSKTVYQTEVQDGAEGQVLESDKMVNINYFDGLGRAKQSIAVRAGGQTQHSNILEWKDDWTIGGGHTPLFNMNGQASDNERIFDSNPFGEQSLVWRCGNDPNRDADGGWNTDYITVDRTVGYRYMVWVKRTGSQDGTTYHGTQNVNNLNGSANNNPYFWHGDLPQLNTWYLLVGVVHPYLYKGPNSGISGVYDSNGNKVKNGNDFKWRSTTTTSRFRSYLYYSTDINVRQYFWNPVLVEMNTDQQPIQEQIARSKPKDIVTHYDYDDFGKQTKKYLPYASEITQNGAIYTDPVAAITSFYNTDKYDNTSNPYSETVFEPSPLNRVLKQGTPGSTWEVKANNIDHTVKFDRRTNISTDSIVYFKVNFTDENTSAPSLQRVGAYQENQLFVSVTKDENWRSSDGDNHTSQEYTDKLGRVVLKRVFNNNDPHDTYYVYDDFGNLTYVIPPKVTTKDGVSILELRELCYQYTYDHRNRLIEKKIPGKGWEHIIYNKLDQPIMTQDPNQRTKNEWLFTKYDIFGRVAYSGVITDNSTRDVLQEASNDYALDAWVSRGDAVLVGGVTMYYTNGGYPNVQNAEVLTVNYYDNYEVGTIVAFNPANGSSTWEGMSATAKVKGLPTVSQVKVLGTSQWITSTTYYDNKGRAWESHVKNEYLNTEDWMLNKLDFMGKVLVTRSTHTKSAVTITTLDTFTYDHIGRMVSHKQKINDQVEELIAYNIYDALGQLQTKKVGNAEQSPLQTLDYSYNIRGWLTGINNTDKLGDDLFSFKINYDSPEHGANALYNGNVSETEWKTVNDQKARWYTYSYDPLNRIKAATGQSNRYNLSNVTYDKMGNIKTLTRNGWKNSSNYTAMDNLSYSYDLGNKLITVNDSGDKNYGFKDGIGLNTKQEYEYDANGNMIVDRNKGISGMTYNHLNLPTNVSLANNEGNGTITYIYDAAGVKQKKIVSSGRSLPITTEYANNYVYKNSRLEFFNTSEGYVEVDNSLGAVSFGLRGADSNKALGAITNTASYSYVYQYKDHLGNIRLSYSDRDKDGKVDVLNKTVASNGYEINIDLDGDKDYAHEILEEKNYYPFGLTHKGYNNTISGTPHNYKYNGIEHEQSLGLDLYEMDWRQYDPAIGRFTSIDPYAKSFSDLTTYHFSYNNPIMFNDPSGLFPEEVASTVVNNQGVIIDHKDDGDPNIYLNSRAGKIVGEEEEGKEYNVGDQLYVVDSEVDTFFELVLETNKIQEETNKLVENSTRISNQLKRINELLKAGVKLTQEDVDYLTSLIVERNRITDASAVLEHKKRKLGQLLEAYQSEIPWKEVGLNAANTAINYISSLLNLGIIVTSVEKPDGTGETTKTNAGNSLKKDLGLRPSNVRRTHQKLPYTLDYHDN